MASSSLLVDTNVLLRLMQQADASHQIAYFALNHLLSQGCVLYYTSQNLGEFWNVLTRPKERNGFGHTPLEANEYTKAIETQFDLLPDSMAVHKEWRNLLVDHAISGVQVHDARLAAAMRVHGIPLVLTFNVRDFARYPRIEAIHPGDIATGLLP